MLQTDGTYSKNRWVFYHPSNTLALRVKKLAESLNINCSITKRLIGRRILNCCVLKSINTPQNPKIAPKIFQKKDSIL